MVGYESRLGNKIVQLQSPSAALVSRLGSRLAGPRRCAFAFNRLAGHDAMDPSADVVASMHLDIPFTCLHTRSGTIHADIFASCTHP